MTGSKTKSYYILRVKWNRPLKGKQQVTLSDPIQLLI